MKIVHSFVHLFSINYLLPHLLVKGCISFPIISKRPLSQNRNNNKKSLFRLRSILHFEEISSAKNACLKTDTVN